MSTEIPPTEWENFCQQFSGQHHSWLITIGELSSEMAFGEEPLDGPGARIVARQLPLQELVLSSSTRRDVRERLAELSIVAGDAQQWVCHRIAPRRLVLEQTDTGAHRGLRIESAGGRTTFIRFRAAVSPESVDGETELDRCGRRS